MQVNASFRPPNRAYTDMSPASTAGSEWSGMNHYHNAPLRPGGSFGVPPRGDSMSPPDSGGSMGAPFYGGNGYDPQYSSYDLHAPLRPPEPRSGSRASSRAGSIAYSMSSDGTIGDQQSRKYQRMEAELRQHYAVLRAYLKGASGQGLPQNRARDKLLRLSPVQFHELSTDVFDELQRRQAATPLPGRPPRGKVPPFLPARMDFHEKRNQARQKLSSLQTSRFRDLSTDVFFELERRFPNFNPEGRPESVRSRSRGPRGYSSSQNSFAPPPRSHTVNGSMSAGPNGFSRRQDSVNYFSNGASIDHGRPMQQQFQSNTITPNKSTMVEDEEDDDGGPISHYARSSDAFGLESVLTSPGSGRDTSATSLTGGSHEVKGGPSTTELQEQVLDLEAKLQAKDDEISELSTIKELKQELEVKLEDAEKLNKSLQEELDRLQSDHANVERDLRSQLSTAKSEADNGEWRSKHEELDREHQNLRSKYEGQLRTTEEVSKQFKIHLADMRAMAEDSGNSLKREEKLHQEIQRLADEIKEWKSRYTKAKTQLRTARQSTIGLGLSRPDMSPTFHAPDGLVKDINVTRFQLAIDELLKAARSERPVAVLDHVKAVVVAVGSVTAELDSVATEDTDEEVSKRRAKLKSKVSVTANNVITASKNFAAADGLSPVSLLDAAASHLTSAMVDLLRIVKIRPTPPGELEVNDEPAPGIVNDAGYFPVTESLRRRSAANSVYSAVSDPPNDHTNQQQSSSQDHLAAQPHMNGYGGSSGLGINPMQGLQADETELEELKVYLGNQTDLLVQSVQGLVSSVRSEDDMAMIRHHISNIVDIAENVVGASEGAMEDVSSFQTSLTESISSTVDVIKGCRDKLERMAIESQMHDGELSAKQFSQGLPPLAFQIARELKELVSRTEGVEVGTQPGDEDFS